MRADARCNRDQIINVARNVFAEEGVDAPLEQVARQAHVGIVTLYRHFPDRQALSWAVALGVLARVAQEARQSLAEEPNAFHALARYMHHALDLRVGLVMPMVVNQISMEDAELGKMRTEATMLIQTMIDNAQTAGMLRPDIAFGDIGVLVIRLTSPLSNAMPAEISHRLAHRYLDIVLDGLRASNEHRTEHLAGPALTLNDLHALSDKYVHPTTG